MMGEGEIDSKVLREKAGGGVHNRVSRPARQ
jgi:hypothetical protein